jgi:hypothetical protein
MPRPDSSDIDAAVVMKLGSDPQLLALMPNGVYFGEAPPGLKQFVVVSLVIAIDVPVFHERGYEDVLYLVKAVELSTMTPRNARAAAARIDELLEDQPLAIPGYGWMMTARSERVRYPEVDDRDRSIRWEHRGGRYQVHAAPDWATP